MYIPINRESSLPITKQINNRLKAMILNGDLRENEKLLASRKLAENLNVSRTTVLDAYEMLASEGYTRSIKGSGVFVNSYTDLSKDAYEFFADTNSEIKSINTKLEFINFIPYSPALEHFPLTKWLKCYRDAAKNINKFDLGFGDPFGYEELRITLSKYLYRDKGIRCSKDQMIITSDITHGIFLLNLLFRNIPGKVLIENPINKVIENVLDMNDVKFIRHAVDDEGLNAKELPKDEKISFIYITPTHKYSAGKQMSLERRIELIEYAKENNCYIIEDGYDSEYRYHDDPVPSFYELSPNRVIYLGSFGNILTPSLQFAYMILPIQLTKSMYDIKKLIDTRHPTLDQIAMEKFIASGYLDLHLNKMKKLYLKRQKFLVDSLNEYFGDMVSISGCEIGLHIIATFKDTTFDATLIKQIKSYGVHVEPVSNHSSTPDRHISKLILGFANLNKDEITRGVNVLYKAITQHD